MSLSRFFFFLIIFTQSCVSSSVFEFTPFSRTADWLFSKFTLGLVLSLQMRSRAIYYFRCLTWQVAIEHIIQVCRTYIHIFRFNIHCLVVISFFFFLNRYDSQILIRRQGHAYLIHIIDIRSMNAVINFWACFVNCFSCVRFTTCAITFLWFFFLRFFLPFSSRA